MIYSLCCKLSKYPAIKNVARFLYSVSAKTMARESNMSYSSANKAVGLQYHKKKSCISWNRCGGAGKDLSVIIPFYKTEKYAVRCIESVLSQQSDYSIEIILVDDGSPDRCGEILDRYGERENVLVIHQENAGVSAARNTGMRHANGEYMLFLDSDDILLPGAISALLDAAREYDADIVEGGHHTFDDKRKRRVYSHEFSVSERGAGMFGYPCGKVIRAKLFDKVCFPENYWYEDTIISYLIHPAAKRTVCIPQLVFGYYVNRLGSTAQTKTSVKCIDTLSIIELILDHYQQEDKELTQTQKEGTLRQLGPFLFFRTRGLNEDLQEAVFILAAEMAEKRGLLSVTPNNYFENELIEALKNHQYKRWKWASILI